MVGKQFVDSGPETSSVDQMWRPHSTRVYTLFLLSMIYTAIVVGGYDCAPADEVNPINQWFELTNPLTSLASAIMPITYIYGSKLERLGYPCTIIMVRHVYGTCLILLALFLLISVRHVKKYEEELRQKLDDQSLLGSQQLKKVRNYFLGSALGAVMAGYVFFVGDLTMDVPSRLSDSVHLSKWNLLRGPVSMTGFYLFTVQLLVLRYHNRTIGPI